MAKTLKFGNAVLCEFIAKGAGNKHSLINVFSGDIIVSDLPATLMLAIYVEYTPDPGDTSELSLHMLMDDELVADMPVSIDFKPNSRISTIVIQGMGFGIKKDVTLRITATATGYRKATIITKRIYKGSISSSDLPQPS